MVKIAVFSDLTYSIRLKEYIESSAVRRNINVEVTIYLNCSHLYEALKKEGFYDIVFLDMDKQPHRALNVAYHIINNMIDKETEFVFMSEYQKCNYEFIKCEPIYYFLKPLNYTEIDSFVKKYICENHLNHNYFVYMKNNIKCRIAVSQIIYLYELENNIVLYTNDQQIEFEGTLSDCLNESCFNNFISTEKNTVVNPAYIEQIARDFLIVAEDIKLPIRKNGLRSIRVNQN